MSASGLNQWIAQIKRRIFDDLAQGRDPSEGEFDAASLKEARTKGSPQLGATVLAPDRVEIQFVFPDPNSAASVVSVTLVPPERIVFLPVPSWVVENIWQGSVDGSAVFESEARILVEALMREIEPEANLKHFGPKQASRRE
jgi:hypothetical protein